MVKTRLMRVAFLAGLLASTSFTTVGPRGEELPDDAETWRRFSERCASDSLRTLSAAEADFQAEDRDWGHVNDFWSTNVEGLYRMTGAEVLQPGTEGAIRVIEFTADPPGADRKQGTAGP